MVSFENDLDSLRLALHHPGYFPHLCHQAPHALLSAGFWQSRKGPIEWSLYGGDFPQLMSKAPPPDIIFHDPFSYKTDAALWSYECFRRIGNCCRGRAVRLFTYSASTLVRACMLAAGFFVAKGRATGPKGETTIALTREAVPSESEDMELLSGRWLERWERSDAKYPADMSEAQRRQFAALVRGHTQFGC